MSYHLDEAAEEAARAVARNTTVALVSAGAGELSQGSGIWSSSWPKHLTVSVSKTGLSGFQTASVSERRFLGWAAGLRCLGLGLSMELLLHLPLHTLLSKEARLEIAASTSPGAHPSFSQPLYLTNPQPRSAQARAPHLRVWAGSCGQLLALMHGAAEPAEQGALLRAILGAKGHELARIGADVDCVAQLQAWMEASVQLGQRSEGLPTLLLLIKVRQQL